MHTDDHPSYKGMPQAHETVRHTTGEYVRGDSHTNGGESFWATLKRGYQGVYHKMSYKHLDRHVQEFAFRHDVRRLDTMAQLAQVVQAMGGQRTTLFEALIA